MAKSDMEDCCDSPGVLGDASFNKMAYELDGSVLDKSNEATIHSGHFMVSDVHHDTDDESDLSTAATADIKEEKVDPEGYDFISAAQEPSQEYHFGSVGVHSAAIDSSLTKLFDCMTLAYSGKLTSPKWKNFKGIKLLLKEKVRLNNIIWREWHMQYIQCRRPIICQFEPPISDKTHTKPEAVVLEGKYWKRRLESVTAEYKKWRLYFKQRFSRRPEDARMMAELASHAELLERVGQQDNVRWWPQQSVATTDQMMEEDFSMDFTDTLFTSLNQPFAFPNPREMSQLGFSCADIIQPGLVGLQPSLDDFMDTLEPLPSLQEMLNNRSTNNSFGSVATSQSVQNLMSSILPSNINLGDSMSLDLMNVSQPTSMDIRGGTSQPTYTNSTNTSTQQRPFHIIPSPAPQHNSQVTTMTVDNNALNSGSNIQTAVNSDPTRQIISVILDSSDLQTDSQRSISPLNLVSKPAMIPNIPTTSRVTPPVTANNGTVYIQDTSQLQSLLESLSRSSAQQTVQTASLAALKTAPKVQGTQPAPVSTFLGNSVTGSLSRTVQSSSLLQNHLSETSPNKKVATATDIARRASTGSMSLGAVTKGVSAKKEGEFLVPQPLSPTPQVIRKPRTIAPAPMPVSSSPGVSRSSIIQQNTFLAQLLTTGSSDRTYPSSVNTVKEETVKPIITLSNFPTVRPAPVSAMPINNNSSSLAYTMANGNKVTDFQKNILVAAASHALGTTSCKISEAISTSVASPIPVANSPTPCLSGPHSPGSPQFQVPSPGSDCSSPGKSHHSGKDNERQHYREHRRVSHISAEQKRRCNIKVGFDTLHHLVPALAANPNKISKAATLQKTADFCRKLKKERAQMQNEAEILKQEIESLNNAISVCQSQLPATGVPVTRQRVDQMRDMFDEYVKNRTLSNWKFWIFSIIIRSLFDTYNNMVSTASVDDLCRTVLAWLEQHCSLVALRPAVLNSLRTLSTTTSILSDPSRVPEQATQAVNRRSSSDSTS